MPSSRRPKPNIVVLALRRPRLRRPRLLRPPEDQDARDRPPGARRGHGSPPSTPAPGLLAVAGGPVHRPKPEPARRPRLDRAGLGRLPAPLRGDGRPAAQGRRLHDLPLGQVAPQQPVQRPRADAGRLRLRPLVRHPEQHRSHMDPANFVRDGKRVGPLKGPRPTLVVDEAIRFIAGAGDRPFALFVTFHAPHEQVAAPEEYTVDVRRRGRPDEARYYGSVSLSTPRSAASSRPSTRGGCASGPWSSSPATTARRGCRRIRRRSIRTARRARSAATSCRCTRGATASRRSSAGRAGPGRDRVRRAGRASPTSCRPCARRPGSRPGRPDARRGERPADPRGPAGERPVPLYWQFDNAQGGPWRIALRRGPWKLLADADRKQFALYNLVDDVAEQHDRAVGAARDRRTASGGAGADVSPRRPVGAGYLTDKRMVGLVIQTVEGHKSLAGWILRPSGLQMLFHLVEPDDPHPRLDELDAQVLRRPWRRDRLDDLDAALEEADGGQGAQAVAGPGAEGAGRGRRPRRRSGGSGPRGAVLRT